MKKYKGTANPELAAAMREIRRSGASGIHADRRYQACKDSIRHVEKSSEGCLT